MNYILFFSILFITLVTIIHAETIKKELLLLTVATKETDGYERYARSVNINGLNSKVLGMGEPWLGGEMATSAGGGQKIVLLKEELEKYKSRENLILLFTDSYDVIVSGNEKEILSAFDSLDAAIVFGAEDFCWPDRSLKSRYPKVRHGYKFLNSGGFIGYANRIYEMVSNEFIGNTDDDQLYFTKIFLDDDKRTKFNMILDTQAKIFQNLNGAQDDVSLDYREDDTRLLNTVYQTMPLIVHGNGNSKVLLDTLGNYLAKSWTFNGECLACSEGKIDLDDKIDYPTVLMSIFVHKPTPFLEEMLQKVANTSYVDNKISLFIHNKMELHEKLVSSWVKLQQESSKWKSVEYASSNDTMKEWHARNEALEKCLESQCDIFFNVDSEVHLNNPETLKLLISYNRPIVAAIMTRVGKAWSTFWGAITDNGYYSRSLDYMDIIFNKRRGLWNVPYITGVYAVRREIIEDPQTRPNYILKLLDSDIAMAANMRANNVFMYASNLHDYGHLVDTDVYKIGDVDADLWQVAANPSDWEARYLHPLYHEAAKQEFINETPCTDVYWFPIFSERFCKEFIDTMERSGKWSTGKNDDPRLSGGYENVPTVDIHMNQVGFDQEWLYILKEYIKPLAEKVYIGFTSKAQSHMNFIVRYKPTEQSFLRPHHDSSTYTINVALNRPGIDYEGGGSHFIRYNCSVTSSRLGWTIMHPGRLTHYHEGLETTKGTRYIMISFIDP